MAFLFSPVKLCAAQWLHISFVAMSFNMRMMDPPEFNGALLILILMTGPLPVYRCCHPFFLYKNVSIYSCSKPQVSRDCFYIIDCKSIISSFLWPIDDYFQVRCKCWLMIISIKHLEMLSTVKNTWKPCFLSSNSS